jgi:cobalt-zinc-cadmium efflux system protein
MSDMMMHAPSHALVRSGSRRSLSLALAATAAWFLVELIAGFYTNSLALIADAAHMLTDVAALSLSMFAFKIASRPATHRKTYGYLRAEILASLANGVLLVLLALSVLYEAYHRLLEPPSVRGGAMLTVAALGLAVNLITLSLLYRSQHECLNVRGAFLHVVGDTLGSVGAIVAGTAMVLWQWYLADPLVSALVSLLILYSSWQLLRESVDVLLEGTPRHLDVASILADLGCTQGVLSVHDLHVWSITSGMPAMSCHVVLRNDADPAVVLSDLNRAMREKHNIEHTTIQIEKEGWLMRPTRIE